jgi:hypothetical protein
MASLTDLPNLVGFFSCSKADNPGGVLSMLPKMAAPELMKPMTLFVLKWQLI